MPFDKSTKINSREAAEFISVTLDELKYLRMYCPDFPTVFRVSERSPAYYDPQELESWANSRDIRSRIKAAYKMRDSKYNAEYKERYQIENKLEKETARMMRLFIAGHYSPAGFKPKTRYYGDGYAIKVK